MSKLLENQVYHKITRRLIPTFFSLPARLANPKRIVSEPELRDEHTAAHHPDATVRR